MDGDPQVGRLEAEDEDAVEDDRQGAEDSDPAAPAMDDGDGAVAEPDDAAQVAPHASGGGDLDQGEDDRRGGEPDLRGDGSREDGRHQIAVLGGDVEGWHGGEDTSRISRVQEGDPGQSANAAGDGGQPKKPNFWWLIGGFAVVSAVVLVLALIAPFSPSTDDVVVA